MHQHKMTDETVHTKKKNYEQDNSIKTLTNILQLA